MKDIQAAGWRNVALGDVAVVASGGTPSRSQPEFWNGDIPWYSSGELNEEFTLEPSETITAYGLERSNAKLFPAGSLLIGMYDTAALKMSILDRDAAFNQAIVGVRPTVGIDLRFVKVAIEFQKSAILAQRRGTRQKNLSLEKIRAINIPLPAIEEQRRIVAVLDEASAGLGCARVNAEANLASALELFEVIKSTALRDAQSDAKSVTLDDVAEISSSLVDPRENAFADLLHLGAGNMITGSDELVDVKTARDEGLISGKYLFDQGCVLYSKIRPYLRKVARPDFAGLCSADVYPLVPKADMIDRDFLFHLLLSDDFTRYAIDGSDRAGMPKVNRNHLFAYSFMLPGLDAQRKAAAKIDEAKRHCDRLVALAEDKLKAIQALRQSLLHTAFSGGLT